MKENTKKIVESFAQKKEEEKSSGVYKNLYKEINDVSDSCNNLFNYGLIYGAKKIKFYHELGYDIDKCISSLLSSFNISEEHKVFAFDLDEENNKILEKYR